LPAKPNSDIKEILRRVKTLEQLIKKFPHLGYCVDFSLLPPGPLPNPFTVNLNNSQLTFSTTNSLLEIKPNPPQLSLGLAISSDLTIEVTPSAAKVEFEVSSYASLSWKINGGSLNSTPSSPAPHNIGFLVVKINGATNKIEFFGNNEESLKGICCFNKN
jgi:hypothetical protein